MVKKLRQIDADKFREQWLEHGENEYVYDTNCFLESIDAAPTIDAVPVVYGRIVWKDRRRGGVRRATGFDEFGVKHTVRYMDSYVERTPYCSVCGKVLGDTFLTYCSNCGAKMDEEG